MSVQGLESEYCRMKTDMSSLDQRTGAQIQKISANIASVES